MASARLIFAAIERKMLNVIGSVRMQDYADYVVERIKIRTRLGYGVLDGERGNPRVRLKPLSESYKLQRSGKLAFFTNKKKKKIPYKPSSKPRLDPTTSVSKSNLTKTGQLLESITSRVRGKQIILFMKENRNDGVKNKDIVKYQSEQGRDFFELTDKEVKGLRNQIKRDLIKLIKQRKSRR